MKTFFAKAVGIPLVAAATLTGAIVASPALAETSAAFTPWMGKINNGYRIHNTTGEELVFKSERQGREVCGLYSIVCDPEVFTFGKGYGVEASQSIPIGGWGYFEVPAFTAFGRTTDATEIVYETKVSKKEIHLLAGVAHEWTFGGITRTMRDLSTVRINDKNIDPAVRDTYVTSSQGPTTTTSFALTPDLLP